MTDPWQNPTGHSTQRPAFRAVRIVLWGLLIVALLALYWPYLRGWLIAFEAEPRPVTARGDLAADERTIIEIFENVGPSVVYITTLSRAVNLWTRDITRIPRGTGSGFVWDEQGHIVTNYHVVAGADAAYVRLEDERVYQAALVGASPEHDLAVLRIDVAFGRPSPVPIGSSADLRVGQKVLAIGNPFGLDRSLTTGVISALNRSINDEDGRVIEDLIQTDAAINPGNSGGPLIDSAGRLIGINTAIYSPSGAYAGIGFAVPVDTVNRVVPQLLAYGKYARPTLGITVDDGISARVTARLGVTGLLVLRVEAGSAAERAGLRGTRLAGERAVIPGDIILAVDGRSVAKHADLIDILHRHSRGDRIELTVYRDGETINVPVVLDR